MSQRGPIQRAVIRRIAKQDCIPVSAAAHRYDMMGIDRKNLLCIEERRRQESRPSTKAAARSPGEAQTQDGGR